jgi:hypothetical protein
MVSSTENFQQNYYLYFLYFLSLLRRLLFFSI